MTNELTPEDAEFQRKWDRRRRRRWVIGIGVPLLVLAALLLAAYGYDLYWQHKVKAKDAQLRAQGKLLTFPEMLARDSYLPAEQNSALVYLEAFKQVRAIAATDVLGSIAYAGPLGARPSQTTADLLAAEAAANAEALATILDAAALKEGCYPFQPAASPWDLLLPHCKKARRAALLCGRVAVLHAAAGKSGEATPYLLAGFGLASSFGRKPLLIEGLVRSAVDSITVSTLERSLSLCQFAPDNLQALKDRLDRERKDLTLDWAFVAERSAARFTFEYLVSSGPAMRGLGAGPIGAGYPYVPGWREKDELLYDELLDETERIRALPPRQALSGMKQFGDTIGSRMRETSPPPVVTAMLLPALSRTLWLEVQAKVQLSMAAAALAAEQYRLKNGRWPNSLEQLVPEFLDAVPEDYFGVGKVHYVRTDTGVLLYSVGPDGQDNGGITQEEFRKTSKPGGEDAYDLPFRLLDPELRGAKTMTFPEDVAAAGLDAQALKDAGVSPEGVKGLR